jgi:probable O-glycosylation ligase (exosortase A-associated)
MYRDAIVLFLITVGAYYALQGPFYALLFYLGNAYFRPEDWVWSDFVKSLRLSLVIGFYLIIVTLLSRQRFVWDGRIALIWSFLFLAFLSFVLSEHSTHSWPYLLEFAKVVVVTYLIVVLTTDFAKFRLIVVTIVLALGLEQAKQGWFYLLTSPGGANTNWIPMFGDNNGTAVGMLMLVPLIGFLIQATPGKWPKGFFVFLLIGSLYRALSSYSRGGFLAAIVLGGTWWLRSDHKIRNLLGILIVLTVVVSALPDAFWDRMGTIQTYEDKQDASALGRLHFWSVAADMAAENPIIGIGFNSYSAAYNSYDSSDGAYGRYRSVHNSFFAVLAELGYTGFLLYTAVIVSVFRACAQVKRLAFVYEALSDCGKLAVALEASLLVFIVGGSFVVLQYSEMVWHLVGVSIALRRFAVQKAKQLALAEQPLRPPATRLTDPFAA